MKITIEKPTVELLPSELSEGQWYVTTISNALVFTTGKTFPGFADCIVFVDNKPGPHVGATSYFGRDKFIPLSSDTVKISVGK